MLHRFIVWMLRFIEVYKRKALLWNKRQRDGPSFSLPAIFSSSSFEIFLCKIHASINNGCFELPLMYGTFRDNIREEGGGAGQNCTLQNIFLPLVMNSRCLVFRKAGRGMEDASVPPCLLPSQRRYKTAIKAFRKQHPSTLSRIF